MYLVASRLAILYITCYVCPFSDVHFSIASVPYLRLLNSLKSPPANSHIPSGHNAAMTVPLSRCVKSMFFYILLLFYNLTAKLECGYLESVQMQAKIMSIQKL